MMHNANALRLRRDVGVGATRVLGDKVGLFLWPADPRVALAAAERATREKITQEELADRSGLFRTYMSRIE